MFTLFVTLLVTLYLLGPDLVSRFVLGFVCPRRLIVQSPSEEITRAVGWAVIPLGVSLLWARYMGPLHLCTPHGEWGTFYFGLTSSQLDAASREAFVRSAGAVFWWNFCVLWRLYALVFAFWISVDFLIGRFGRIRRRARESKSKFLNLIAFFLGQFIVPRVSEWHLYLSTMLTEFKDARVHADILTKGDNLYQGAVEDKTLTADGKLGSVTLKDAYRFQRQYYLEAKKLGAANKDDFWVPLGGSAFVVMAGEIMTINLRYSSSQAANQDNRIREAIRQAVEEYLTKHPPTAA